MLQCNINLLVLSFSALVICTLTACGGDSSNDGNAYSGPGTEVSASAFDVYSKPGVWRTDFDFDFESEIDYAYDGKTYTFNTDVLLETATTFSVDYINQTEIVLNGCDGADPERVTDSGVTGEDFITEFDDEEFDLWDCETELRSHYFVISDDEYRIGISCENTEIARVSMLRISSTPEFNQGAFAISSEMFPDADTTNGVCGNSSYMDVEIEPQSDELGDDSIVITSNSMGVAAPYGSSQIDFTMTFSAMATTGTYTVTEFVDEQSAQNQVAVLLTSPEFGGSGSYPATIYGLSGSVTLISVSDYQVSGRFSIETDVGDAMSGSFSYDIQ